MRFRLDFRLVGKVSWNAGLVSNMLVTIKDDDRHLKHLHVVNYCTRLCPSSGSMFELPIRYYLVSSLPLHYFYLFSQSIQHAIFQCRHPHLSVFLSFPPP